MSAREYKKLLRVNLGLTDYRDAWELQRRLVVARASDKIPDCLLVTEHTPVITMGRGTSKDNLLVSEEELRARGIALYEVERGGDITFHGPGQVVLYPIIDLRDRGKDVRQYLRDLEASVVDALGQLGLKAAVKEGLTGVWVNDRKLAAIGVAVSRWVTYHGVAVNVDTSLDYFDLIHPCGIKEYRVGSISGELGRGVALKEVTDLLAWCFTWRFGYKVEVLENLRELKF